MAPSGTCSKAGTPWTEQYNKTRRIHTEYRALPHGGEKISVIGMGSSVIGGGNRQQLRQALGFLDAPADAMGKCVYCKHGPPCPAGLDVAQSSRMQEILAYFGA